ncbi:hypothetical protein [Spartinivicinus poritis]|uniref:Uncharacterized protein n=1 Tax=Spartinivicinus poritis TaxID=2994640 RepID=A0ABT5ULU4_9GAMM|nr:hypothetical protein [Spartinivicinus sp. A2-2]MDE1465989.1 hypothetical protein [Spartinivicinus sp. A2-2]
MSNFRHRLRLAVEELVTHQEKIKYRLESSIGQLILANVPEDNEVPNYFREKHAKIIKKVTTCKKSGNDIKVRDFLHGKRGSTLSKIALEIWKLYLEYEDYLTNDCIPNRES